MSPRTGSPWVEALIIYVLAAGIAAALMILLRPLALRLGLLDHPGGRKGHSESTPLIGGVAIFLAFSLSVLLLDAPLGGWRPFFFASLLVFIIGLLDDFGELSAAWRFIAQLSAMLIMVFWADLRLTELGGLVGGEALQLGWLAVPFTLFCGAGVMNAANMVDGMDGLLGLLLLVLFGVLAALAWRAGLVVDARLLSLLCAVLAVFLLFNFRFAERRHARVFLGDAGSLFLGMSAAWFLIRFSQKPVDLIRPITAVWLFAVPLLDTVTLMIRRHRRGRSPFAADREHIHHLLHAAGFSVRSTVLIIVAASLLFATIGLAGQWAGVPEWVMLVAFLLLFAIYYLSLRQAVKVLVLRYV